MAAELVKEGVPGQQVQKFCRTGARAAGGAGLGACRRRRQRAEGRPLRPQMAPRGSCVSVPSEPVGCSRGETPGGLVLSLSVQCPRSGSCQELLVWCVPWAPGTKLHWPPQPGGWEALGSSHQAGHQVHGRLPPGEGRLGVAGKVWREERGHAASSRQPSRCVSCVGPLL